MIRAIAAIDAKRGLATEHGIPWDLPTDVQHFRNETKDATVVMGRQTYNEFSQPLAGRRNIVVSHEQLSLRPGFELINDIAAFLKSATNDIWIIGGAGLYELTITMVDELYLTEIEHDFKCTKFFPPYKQAFHLVGSPELHVENDVVFRFCTYTRKRNRQRSSVAGLVSCYCELAT